MYTDPSRMLRTRKLWDQSKTNGDWATKHEAMPTNKMQSSRSRRSWDGTWAGRNTSPATIVPSHTFPWNSLRLKGTSSGTPKQLCSPKKMDMEPRKPADMGRPLGPWIIWTVGFPFPPRIEDQSRRATGNHHQLAVGRPNDAVGTPLAASTWVHLVASPTGNWQHNWEILILDGSLDIFEMAPWPLQPASISNHLTRLAPCRSSPQFQRRKFPLLHLPWTPATCCHRARHLHLWAASADIF